MYSPRSCRVKALKGKLKAVGVEEGRGEEDEAPGVSLELTQRIEELQEALERKEEEIKTLAELVDSLEKVGGSGGGGSESEAKVRQRDRDIERQRERTRRAGHWHRPSNSRLSFLP